MFGGCTRQIAPTPSILIPPKVVQPVRNNLIVVDMPNDPANMVYAGLENRDQILRLYGSLRYATIWIENNRLSSQGDSLVMLIRNLRYYGLLPLRYHLAEVNTLYDNMNLPGNLMRLDVLLTDAFLSVARDIKYGRIAGKQHMESDSLQLSLLRDAIGAIGVRNVMAEREPRSEGYSALKIALRSFLDTVRHDERSELLAGLAGNNETTLKRIQLLEINMERWKWEKDGWDSRYIFVNIPAFELQVMRNDSVKLTSRIIVGKPESPTPLLTSRIECLIVYPYWNVPRKIVLEEYLPAIQKNISFLTRNNFEVLNNTGEVVDPYSLDWAVFDEGYFPYRIRQKEGTENSLGVIKFEFDNPYSVFLHDTNAKRLFKNEVRAFSHGCIRMEKAIELAHFLVMGQTGRKSRLIEKKLRTKQRAYLDVKEPYAIYVRYLTAEYRNGKLFEYGDIYQRDKRLIDQMYGPKEKVLN